MKQKHIVTKQLSFLIAMILVCLQLLPIGAFAVGQAQPQEEMMQAQAASTKNTVRHLSPKAIHQALIINSLVHHGAPDITQGKTIIAAMIHWSPLHQVQFSAAGGIIAMATTS